MWDGFGANLGKRRKQAGFPEKHWGSQAPKCQSGARGQGEIRRGRAEEQSGDECVVRGTEQQQSEELENKEQNKEKAKGSNSSSLTMWPARRASGGSLGQPAGKPDDINSWCVVGGSALWQLHTSAARFLPLLYKSSAE